MSALTCQGVGMVLLGDLGIFSLDPASPADQANSVTDSDKFAVAVAMTQAWQEIAHDENGEPRTQPGGAYLRAPVSVTLTATEGDTAIASMVTFAAWMAGCTIRISGDDQDNELLTATKLARPYIGTTGTGIAATVYADAVTLDSSVAKVVAPMFTADRHEVVQTTTRIAFATSGGYPIVDAASRGPSFYEQAFWAIGRKPTGPRPCVYFLDRYYDPALDYVQLRVRLSPMPDQKGLISFSAAINPPRVTVADIDGPGHADAGTKIPMLNGCVESIFLPIARQINSGNPRFHNDGIRAEIARQFALAKNRLKDSDAALGMAETFYW